MHTRSSLQQLAAQTQTQTPLLVESHDCVYTPKRKKHLESFRLCALINCQWLKSDLIKELLQLQLIQHPTTTFSAVCNMWTIWPTDYGYSYTTASINLRLKCVVRSLSKSKGILQDAPQTQLATEVERSGERERSVILCLPRTAAGSWPPYLNMLRALFGVWSSPSMPILQFPTSFNICTQPINFWQDNLSSQSKRGAQTKNAVNNWPEVSLDDQCDHSKSLVQGSQFHVEVVPSSFGIPCWNFCIHQLWCNNCMSRKL